MSITPKTRFEIFKRDAFTCRYCGQSSPAVVLEVDHIIPRAEGGSDDEMNLVTSCFACNRGKGATPLDTVTVGSDPHDAAVELLERERQLREYNEVLRQVREREDADIRHLEQVWGSVFTDDETMGFRSFLQTIPVTKIEEALTIASMKSKPIRYAFGVLSTWVRES